MATWQEMNRDSLQAPKSLLEEGYLRSSISQSYYAMSKEQVVQRVQERLRDCHPGGVSISVVESEVRLKDDYWYVPVQPSAQPPRTFEYYEVLADVETELSEHERLKVWLVPTLPEEPAPSPAASP